MIYHLSSDTSRLVEQDFSINSITSLYDWFWWTFNLSNFFNITFFIATLVQSLLFFLGILIISEYWFAGVWLNIQSHSIRPALRFRLSIKKTEVGNQPLLSTNSCNLLWVLFLQSVLALSMKFNFCLGCNVVKIGRVESPSLTPSNH